MSLITTLPQYAHFGVVFRLVKHVDEGLHVLYFNQWQKLRIVLNQADQQLRYTSETLVVM